MATNRTIEQLTSDLAPEIRKAFLASVQGIKKKTQLAQLVRMLENGDVEGALKAVGIDVLKFRPLEAAIVDAYQRGGDHQAGKTPAVRQPDGYVLRIGFDIQNPRAEQWLYSHSGTLIREITDDQRNLIAEALRVGMQAGSNPRDVALSIAGRINNATGQREGGLIGLTSRQAEWARGYAADLRSGNLNALQRELRDRRFDRTVRNAIKEKRPLTEAEITPMVRAYENRALRYRAEALARTEAMASLSASSMESMQQAIDGGQITSTHVKRVWHATRDKRTRDTHLALDKTAIGFTDMGFISPSGALIRWPGDPEAPAAERINCRCYLELRVDFLASVAPPREPKEPKKKPVDRKKLDQSAREDVLEKGRASGIEHIAAFNTKTGEVLENTMKAQTRNRVTFSASFVEAMTNPENTIIAHHNHPSSTSLSEADLRVVAHYPGLETIYAHGHDGSQYMASSLKAFSDAAYKRIGRQVQRALQVAVNEKKITTADAGQIHNHLLNSLYARAGYISYDATFDGGTSEAVARTAAIIREILEK